MEKAKNFDEYAARHPEWRPLLEQLHNELIAAGFTATIKWGAPTYTYQGKNLVGLGAFKQYAGLWFYQGALIDDHAGKLINAQEGKTKALRQWRMHSEADLDHAVLKDFLEQAIALQNEGICVAKTRPQPVKLPLELQQALAQDAVLSEAFNELTAYKQKEYASHIGDAKRENTRLSRLQKCRDLILQGVGLHDKYRR